MKKCIAVVLAVMIGVFGMYTKHNFASGETLYASQLNEMDDEIKNSSDISGEIGAYKYVLENIYNKNDESIEEGGIYLSSGVWYENASFFESGFLPTKGNGEILYINIDATLHVNVYNASKTWVSGGTTVKGEDGWQTFTVVAQSAKYIRIGVPNENRETAIVTGNITPERRFVINENIANVVLDALLDTNETTNQLFNDAAPDITENGVYLSNGNWYSNTGFFETGFLRTVGNGETIYFSGTAACHVVWYNSNKEFLNGSTSTAYNDELQKVTIASSTARYFRIGLPTVYRFNAYVANTPTIQTLQTHTIKPEYLSEGKWSGKNWIAFGTSITDTSFINQETGTVTGKYVPYLEKLSGMKCNNNGIAGGLWCGNILDRVLATDVSDADLITIEGCVNDFAAGSEIGNVGDVGSDTIAGAMWQMVDYISRNSKAVIVFITESTGKEYTFKNGTTADYRITYKKANGHIQQDYNDAIIRFSSYLNVPCIDAGKNAQISYFHPEYIIDNIHHTELGGQQYAQAIWDGLKNISPAN